MKLSLINWLKLDVIIHVNYEIIRISRGIYPTFSIKLIYSKTVRAANFRDGVHIQAH
jgi:hypothetical protein